MGLKSNLILQYRLSADFFQVFSDEALISLSVEGQGSEDLWFSLSTHPKSRLSDRPQISMEVNRCYLKYQTQNDV